MKHIRLFTFSLLMTLFCACPPVHAEGVFPVQLSLFSPVQLARESTSIHGLRINLLYGANEQVKGLDLGMVNRTRGGQSGLQLGAVNVVSGGFDGEQLGIVNVNDRDVVGLQLGVVNFNRGATRGHMYGLLANYSNIGAQGMMASLIGNSTHGEMNGIQVGFINHAGDLDGWQFGAINLADSADGLQIGIFNYAQELKGLQIGLLNIASAKENWSILPLVNANW